MHKIGIMQGRLTPSRGRGVQFFPFDEWQQEFEKARRLGLYDIDFIFDLDRYKENPIWSESGRTQIKNCVKNTGVRVEHVTADFFMRRPFFRCDKDTREENELILIDLLNFTKEIGAKNIEMPLLDNSSIKTKEEKDFFIKSISHSLSKSQNDITITIESDLPANKFLELLKEIDNPRVKMLYDTGNSAALGYNPVEELNLLKDYLLHIHIKDRLFEGKTVYLGTGSTKFNDVFETLHKIKFKGNIILQSARGEDGQEEKTIETYKNFVLNHLSKYWK